MTKPHVVDIYIAPDKGIPMKSVNLVWAIGGRGLDGDRYAKGRGTFSDKDVIRQVTLIGLEQITESSAAKTRRNIITKGIDVETLVGREFSIGRVTMRGVEICAPDPPRENASHNYGGVGALILTSGLILPDAEIKC